MKTPRIRFTPLLSWSVEHGTGRVVAVLFALEVPAPGVGWECQPTNPTGDRHGSCSLDATHLECRARPARLASEPACRQLDDPGTHCEPPRSIFAPDEVERALRLRSHGLRTFNRCTPRDAGHRQGLRCGDCTMERTVRPRPRRNSISSGESRRCLTCSSGVSLVSQSRNQVRRPISGGLFVGTRCLGGGLVAEQIRALPLGLQLPEVGDRGILVPLANCRSRDSEESRDGGLSLDVEPLAKLALGDLGHDGVSLRGLKANIKPPKGSEP